jgi:excisionase family DNA binding protein
MINLDVILKSPERAAEVPLDEIPKVLADLSALHIALSARLMNGMAPIPVPFRESPTFGDKLITPQQAAELLGVKISWLYRNQNRLPFARKLSRRQLRFDKAKLLRWRETRIPPL